MNLILLGPPGAGKGTQAKLIEEQHGLIPISTGDLVRAEIARESQIGLSIKQTVEAGKFPSDEIILSLIRQKILNGGPGYLFDGVPRTLIQAKALEKQLADVGQKIDLVIAFDVDFDVLLKRISGRFSCARCGEIYNMYYSPPKKEGVCDKCGSTEFSYRKDDNEDAVRTRLDVYREQTEPLILYYKDKAILKKVDGMTSVEEVSCQIHALITNFKSQACA